MLKTEKVNVNLKEIYTVKYLAIFYEHNRQKLNIPYAAEKLQQHRSRI